MILGFKSFSSLSLSGNHVASIENGYKISSLDQVYKGVAQRWLFVYSAKAYNTEIATLDRDKTLNSLVKRLKYHDLAIAQSISLPNIMEEESLKQNSVALCAPSNKLFFSLALKGKGSSFLQGALARWL